MGRDKRIYRFLQDTRYGRKVLAENVSIPEVAEAVTKYVAQRMIERERALVETAAPINGDARREWRSSAAADSGVRSARSCSACSPASRRWSRSRSCSRARASSVRSG